MLKIQALYKFLSNLSKREKIIFYATTFFVLLAFLDRLIIYPIYSKIRSINNEVSEKESGIVQNLRILSQKDRIEYETKKYASFFNKSKSEEENMTSFFKEIENLANKSSLYVVDIKPAGAKEYKNKTQKLLVNLNCEGQMEQIMDFMYSIENSRGLLTIEKYQISPKSKESSIAQASISISKLVISD